MRKSSLVINAYNVSFVILPIDYSEIALVLTGMGKDGIMGVQAINRMGGKAIAQDEETSKYFSLPRTAIKTGTVDFILPLSEIASTLVSLVMG